MLWRVSLDSLEDLQSKKIPIFFFCKNRSRHYFKHCVFFCLWRVRGELGREGRRETIPQITSHSRSVWHKKPGRDGGGELVAARERHSAQYKFTGNLQELQNVLLLIQLTQRVQLPKKRTQQTQSGMIWEEWGGEAIKIDFPLRLEDWPRLSQTAPLNQKNVVWFGLVIICVHQLITNSYFIKRHERSKFKPFSKFCGNSVKNTHHVQSNWGTMLYLEERGEERTAFKICLRL